MTISRDIGINFDDITPAELAKEFCEMDADNQALFFYEIAIESRKWKKPFCFQLQNISDSESMTEEARVIMSQIGEYSRQNRKGKVQ